MFHVSFRYIFGIPPLILVLLPVTSSNCHLKDKEGKGYKNVILVSIDELDKMLHIDSNCLKKEPNYFKKHSCADKKEAAFLNRAAYKLEQFVKMNITADFELHLLKVSQGTLKLINCTKEETVSKEPKKNDQCFLKTLLQKIKTCWNKILRGH
ncbi:interleukin-7 isoform X1 [Cavia porcellus]|uniref:Interleukin-7 n=2 Tax=Cavia porcellus TaxID=10141 RepID=A0A286XWK0_CAVPO|nr:interleukin-7 isoform X1 [Cavia porcellus]